MSFEEQIMSKDISEHIFAPNGDYRVYYLPNARSFENWGYLTIIP